MYKGLALFEAAGAVARHAAQRQTLVARNIANADTPGYRPMDLPDPPGDFRGAGGGGLRTTRPGHISAALGGAAAEARMQVDSADAAPDGNAVSLETEMVRAAEIRRQHDMALTVYRSGIDLLRTSLGRGR